MGAQPILSTNNVSHVRDVIVYSIIFMIISISVVATRMYVRVKIIKNPGPEDYTILMALILALLYTSFTMNATRYGFGRHIDTISPDELQNMLKSFYAIVICYIPTLGAVKLSILFQYLRLFIGKSFRWTCYFMIAFITAFTLCAVFLSVFDCTPYQYFWDKTIPGGKCLKYWVVSLVINCIHIITDFLIYFLPLPVLYKLRLRKRQKFGLLLIFSIGGFVVLTSIIRLLNLYDSTKGTDVSWNSVPLTIWTVIEGHTAIICACLPALQPLVSGVLRSMGISTDPDSYTQSAVRTTIPRSSIGHQRPCGENWSGEGSAIELNKEYSVELNHKASTTELQNNPDAIVTETPWAVG